MKILLDIDGVLADFNGGVARLFGLTPEELLSRIKPGEWSLEGPLGVTTKEFWKKIGEAGEDFWDNLEPYPWALDLYEVALRFGDVCLLSSPSQDPSSWAGRVRWIQKHFGKKGYFENFLLGNPKGFCASPNSILIDDKNANVRDFVDAHGHAILFPQIWNDNYHLPESDRLGYVTRQLEDLEWMTKQ